MEMVAKSIIEMGRGAFIERADYEMAKVMDNILDANTKATAKLKITLTMEFEPDDTRTNVQVRVTAKSLLAATNPVTTSLYIAGNDSTGEVQAVEMVPQVPGQIDVFGQEQEAPHTLKLVKFA